MAQPHKADGKNQDNKLEEEQKQGSKTRLAKKAVHTPLSGFVTFLRVNAVVSLAVGFVLATQVQGVVKQLIASFIDPLFKLVGGKTLSDSSFQVRDAKFGWGAFVYALLNFLVIVAVIYTIIKLFKLDKLDKKD